MSNASTTTWLSLDRYAQIMGIDPMHFAQVYSTLRPDTNCSEVWFQWAWQDAAKTSREDLARAINDAERQIAKYIGYNLLPDWTVDERQRITRPANPVLYNLTAQDPRGQKKSLFTDRAHLLSGGTRVKSVIQAGAAVVRSDVDGDGYAETCTVTVATDVDDCEIHVYLPGRSGADAYEVRPITTTDNGATVTIKFKIWQIVKPDQLERLDASEIDGDVAGSFETTVDVYRVYNDPQTQVQFLWEAPTCGNCGGSGCTACQLSTQDGCLTVRDTRRGIATYSPATWDADTETFTADTFTECRDPDRVRLWYYSGYRDETRPCAERDLDLALERAIAYYATCLLDRPLCTCQNVANFAEKWREDLAMSNSARSFQNGVRVLDNDFGTCRGAVYAWGIANEDGRKVARW